MIKKALILFFVSITSSIIHNPLKTSYQGSIHYPSKPEEFDHHRENHWTEIHFFFDSQCNHSISKKTQLETYFKRNRTIGRPAPEIAV